MIKGLKPEEGQRVEQQEKRYSLLLRVFGEISTRRHKIWDLFDAQHTVHADLDLNWIEPRFMESSIDNPKEFQVVIATVQPGQKSKAHYHEVGASTFRVLGKEAGLSAPQALIYREGILQPESNAAHIIHEVQCKEGLMKHIPSGTVHQFENKTQTPARLLIVTHPIICVEEGHEDIHFVKQ